LTDSHTNITKQSIYAGDVYLTICVGWEEDQLVLVWPKLIHFSWRYARKTIFIFSSLATLVFDLKNSNLLLQYSTPLLRQLHLLKAPERMACKQSVLV